MNRTMKVYKGSSLSTAYYGSNYRNFPELRLRGDWLREYGFLSGVSYTVEASEGQLVLKVQQPV